MPTSFSFQHVFRATSVADVFAAYFDTVHQTEQDRALGIRQRTVTEQTDTPDTRFRACEVTPDRKLPSILSPLVKGTLLYFEKATWKKADDRIDLVIIPNILAGHARIDGVYRLEPAGSGLIKRTYEGTVTVSIPLLGGRIERGIVAEFATSMPLAAQTTQAWLDRHLDRPLNPENSSGIIIA